MALMDLFVANRGEPIQHDGQELYWTYYVRVQDKDKVEIRFRDFVPYPVQGLAVNCDGCVGTINGMKAKKFQLWTDTAPEVIEISISRAKHEATLAFFNVWGDARHSPMMYRLNNAAILPEPLSDGTVILHCSDGIGPPDFSDLVATVRVNG
jgi:hypothetical protein